MHPGNPPPLRNLEVEGHEEEELLEISLWLVNSLGTFCTKDKEQLRRLLKAMIL